MALQRFGFIVTGAGLDPAQHRSVMSAPAFTMIAVGVASPAQGAAVARALVEQDGVQLIELCGGFGAAETLQVQQAVPPQVPVGAVRYGPEVIASMHRLFAD
ncbi:MAG: hypothetical protein HY855_14645 [Burkholderiales bacterium]|nr:hypothetical protein [Burkholderiales bacterium]